MADKPGAAQAREVLGDHGLAAAEHPGQLVHALIARRQGAQDAQAVFVAQGTEGLNRSVHRLYMLAHSNVLINLLQVCRHGTIAPDEASHEAIEHSGPANFCPRGRDTLGGELELGRLIILDIEGFPIRRRLHVVHRKGKRLSPAARAFKQFMLEEARALLQGGRAGTR